MRALGLAVACAAICAGYLLHINRRLDGAPLVGKTTMQALHYAQFGEPAAVLQMMESAVPSFRSWEVLIEVNGLVLFEFRPFKTSSAATDRYMRRHSTL